MNLLVPKAQSSPNLTEKYLEYASKPCISSQAAMVGLRTLVLFHIMC
jgi:hypothetical protein